MRSLAVLLAGLALASCGTFQTQPSAVSVAPQREAAFVAMVEGAGCELHQEDNDALLDPAGFSDPEATAISQQLLAEGRAEITPEGNLVLLTENCV
jgi:hypothetical protein